jgi:hypothetical protein
VNPKKNMKMHETLMPRFFILATLFIMADSLYFKSYFDDYFLEATTASHEMSGRKEFRLFTPLTDHPDCSSWH